MTGNTSHGAARAAQNANCRTLEPIGSGGGGGGPFLRLDGGVMTGPIIFDPSQPTGTTLTPGIVQLTDSVSSTSVTTAATPNSVKTAYDAAIAAAASAAGALPLAGGTMTGIEAFTGAGALASPPLTGTVTLTKLSGANGPLRIINGGPWVDPGAPTQPVIVFQPLNAGIGINMDLMPTMTSSAASQCYLDICNTDLRFLGTTAGQTWLHMGIGNDSNYYVGGDKGAGGTIGSLILQSFGAKVGVGNFGLNYSGRAVPYYFTLRPYTTTLNFGIEIDTEATGMQLHSRNDAGTRIPLSVCSSNLVVTNDLAAGQRTKFFTVRPATNLNLTVNNTVETGTATTAVELSALADDETTQKALVARALRYEFLAGGTTNLRLTSSASGNFANIYSDNGSGANKPIMFGETAVSPLVNFQFHSTTNVNVGIDNTGTSGRVQAFNDTGTQAALVYQATSHFFNLNGAGTQLAFAQFRPVTNVNVAIDNTGTSGRIQAFDDSAGILGMVYKASSNFFDFDGTATKLLSGAEFRLATNVRAALDSNSSVARLYSFNDSGTNTPMQYLASLHTFGKLATGLATAGGVAAPVLRATGNALANELLGFGSNDLYITTPGGTIGSIAASGTGNASRIFSSHYNGTSYAITGNIAFTPTGTHGVSDRGVKLDIQTIPSGSTALATALTIDGSQNLVVPVGNLQITTAGKSITLNAGLVSGVLDPISAQDAVTLNYLQGNAATKLGIESYFFGDGSDGAYPNSGTTTLTRDAYYSSMTVSGASVLVTAGYRVFVSGTLDITGASANQIIGQTAATTVGGAGNVSGAAGAASTSFATGTSGGPMIATAGSAPGGRIGGTGTTTTGSNGTAVTAFQGGGGSSGSSGAGGAGTAGATAGGTLATGLAPSPLKIPRKATVELTQGVALLGGGQGGAGAGGGGGDGTAGAGGGGGGTGGAVVAIFAKTLTCSGAASGSISVIGGAGGAGGTATGGNRGGGGGGSAGGGGVVYILYETKTGSAANAINISGGNGGAGGNGFGSAGNTGGDGGAGGGSGVAIVVNITSGVITVTGTPGAAAVAGTAHSGLTGGGGGTGTVLNAGL